MRRGHSCRRIQPAHRVSEALLRTQRGQQAEDWACELLCQQGARILQRNYRRRCGELDLIALHEGTLLVVEVRFRDSGRFGGAAASVTARKRARITRTASLWLQAHGEYAHLPVRFDVVAIEPTSDGRWRRQWLRQAFEAA